MRWQIDFSRRKTCFLIVSAPLFFFTLLAQLQAQSSYVILPNGERVVFKDSGPGFCSITLENGELKSLEMTESQEIISIIVTFKGAPLSIQRDKKLLGKLENLREEHASFRATLDRLTGRLQAKSSFPFQYSITHEYYRAINGVAMDCNRGLISHLYALPMVDRLSLDGQVRIDLEHSVPQIRADLVQNQMGLKGAGVLVGVLDTGIDYSHPALGGGIGEGYRIEGGYDFAYDDADPMDEHGHGTHVAGIIGANSDTVIGVAPEVSFLAVKVLNDDGMGWISDAIDGIEYCLDPDGDPVTDDVVDIMNMSFGGTPMPDDPLVTAVNNAAAAGILSVAAAGNSGFDNPFSSAFRTVGTPGTAEIALTVGACDTVDLMADFSSKGPDPIDFAIKPEIVAPGVQIRSCYPNGQTERFSGTSMAAPHVAGAAALLKQQHPEWTTSRLKWALVNSAMLLEDNEINPYVQGNGRIDVWNAAHLSFTVEPGVLSFGLVDLALDVWRDTLEFTITNLDQATRSFNLEPTDNLPFGAHLTLSQTSFSLVPQGEETITAIMEVSESVSIVEQEPFAYWGQVFCTADTDTVRVPFGFAKSNCLVVECDVPPENIYVWDPSSIWSERIEASVGRTRYTVSVEAGTYNVTLIFAVGDTVYFVERQNVVVCGLTYVSLSHLEARFTAFPDVVYDAHDIPRSNEDVIFKQCIFKLLRYQESESGVGKAWRIVYFLRLNQLHVSPLDSIWNVLQIGFWGPEENMTWLNGFPKEIQSQEDLDMPSGSSNLSTFNVHFRFPDTVAQNQMAVFESCIFSHRPSSRWISGYNGSGLGWSASFPEHSQIAFSRERSPVDLDLFRAVSFGINDFQGDKFHKMAFCRVYQDGQLMAFSREPDPPLPWTTVFHTWSPNDTITINPNAEIHCPFVRVVAGNNEMDETSYVSAMPRHMIAFFDGVVSPTGLLNEMVWEAIRRIHLQLFEKGTLKRSQRGWSFVDLIDGRHRLLGQTVPYSILGQTGRTTVDFEFDTREETLTTPALDVIQILADGHPVKWLRPGQNGVIRLALYDQDLDIETVKIFLVTSSGESIELVASKIADGEYRAAVPDSLPHEFIEVEAWAEDVQGSRMVLNASPAFFFGESLTEMQFDSRVQMTSYELENINDYPFRCGDTLHYVVTLANWGNLTANEVVVRFPETDLLKPLGQGEISIANLTTDSTYNVPLDLQVVQDFQEDASVEYSPVVSWESGGKSYSRNYRILMELYDRESGVVQSDQTSKFGFTLYNNYPNPFNQTTTISYELHEQTRVQLLICDVLGKHVTTLVDASQPAGDYEVIWDGRDVHGQEVASGIYFLQSKRARKVGKILLIK